MTLHGPWIVIYLRNKNQPDALSFLIYFNNYPLHVSNRLTYHHQEAVYCIWSLWYLSYWKYIKISVILLIYTLPLKNIKHYIVCKVSNCIKRSLVDISNSQNAIGSYVTVKYCTYQPRWLVADTIKVQLVLGYVDVGVLIG